MMRDDDVMMKLTCDRLLLVGGVGKRQCVTSHEMRERGIARERARLTDQRRVEWRAREERRGEKRSGEKRSEEKRSGVDWSREEWSREEQKGEEWRDKERRANVLS